MTRSYRAKKADAAVKLDITPSQQTHNVVITSFGRRCDVMTSLRRRDDVIMTLFVYWGAYPALHTVVCDFDKKTVKVSDVKWTLF